jgi:hypothetical protein
MPPAARTEGAERPDSRQAQAAAQALARLNARAWGVSVGLLCGLGLLIATWTLVLRGGPVVGPHLGLLAIFLPGYSVTWVGGIIGFIYAFVLGYALGRLVGTVYNAVAPGHG